MNPGYPGTNTQSLAGGGEMGALIRAKDWSKTSIGKPEGWPQSLRTALSLVVHAKFPMLLLWGRALICFYNDACCPSLRQRQKHPEILGKSPEQAWPELWVIIQPLIEQVLLGGEATINQTQLAPFFSDGSAEAAHWNFSFSPILDENGMREAVLIIGHESTFQLATGAQRHNSESQFRNLVMQSPIPTAILRGKDFVIEMANKTMLEKIWRRDKTDVIGRKVFDVFPEFKDRKYPERLHEVYISGKKYIENESLAIVQADDGIKEFYLDHEYAALFETDGSVSAVIITVNDVTEKVEARKKTEHAEQRLRLAIEAAQMGTFDWNLETQEFFSSDRLKEIFGFGSGGDVTHQNLIDAFHPDDKHIREKAIGESFGIGGLEYEIRIVWPDRSTHWIRVYGKILHDQDRAVKRMYGTVIDVTEQRTILENLKENEARFRLLANSMPQFIWTGDARGNLNYFNFAVYNYSGLSPEQIKKDGWAQIVHPDESQESINQWINSVTTGEDFIFEHRFRRHDGEYRWQLSRAVPQRDANGNILIWVGTSTDIHDQKMFAQELEEKIDERTHQLKKTNEELKKSEERYHLMVDEVQDYAILYLNREGIIENWNKGAEKIKGYSAQEIIGKNFLIFYTEEDKKNKVPQKLLEEASRCGKATHEGWRVRKDGSLFWGNIVLTALHDEQKNVIGFSKVTRDLTAKKEADDKIRINAEQLAQKNKELEKMNAELESFAYLSSHDLQEPLRKIQTFASLIVEKELQRLSENGMGYFRRMQSAAKRMQLLINDLLSYSRASTVAGTFVHTDLREIIAEVKNELKETLEEKNGIIESEGNCMVNVIAFQFHQLMLNLIGNSIKFSKPGIPPRIQLKCEILSSEEAQVLDLPPKKLCCHFTVADNGIGFEPIYADRIFQVFQRLHGKDQYEGTGIGLAIVKKIVDNHNGVIRATGEPGKGARFDIYFPA